MKDREWSQVYRVSSVASGSLVALLYVISSWSWLMESPFVRTFAVFPVAIIFGIFGGTFLGLAADSVATALRLPWEGWGEGIKARNQSDVLFSILVTVALPVCGLHFWGEAMGRPNLGWSVAVIIWLLATCIVSLITAAFGHSILETSWSILRRITVRGRSLIQGLSQERSNRRRLD